MLGMYSHQLFKIMRVFAVSDIHLDYELNQQWLQSLSNHDYQDDVLILAGDISDDLSLVAWCFEQLQTKFMCVHYVVGNHELWVRKQKGTSSIDKYWQIHKLAEQHSIEVGMREYGNQQLTIIPFASWYDYSFGKPSPMLRSSWVDYSVCKWPEDYDEQAITHYFLQLNQPFLGVECSTIISFSHFLPRIDLMPSYIPERYRYVYPVLGTDQLELQLRTLQAQRHIHIYGHSHVNQQVRKGGIEYINNAFGYPAEGSITRKQLLCVWSD